MNDGRDFGPIKKLQREMNSPGDQPERAGAVAAIRRGMEQFERGQGISLDEAEERLRLRHGFSR